MQRLSPTFSKLWPFWIAVGALLMFSPFLIESWEAFARAGGSGGGGSGGSSSAGRSGSVLGTASHLISLAAIALAAAHAFLINRKINRRRKEISKILSQMSQLETEWSEVQLERQVRQKFILLQEAWSRQDLQIIKRHLKDDLYAHWHAEIAKQISENQRNYIEKVEIKSVRFVSVRNYINNENDEFTACIDATCHEQMVPLKSDQAGKSGKLQVDHFREFWTFEREVGEWKLRDVRQFSAWARLVSAEIVDEIRGRYTTKAPDTPSIRLSPEKRLLGEKAIAKKSAFALCTAMFFPFFALAFFEPVNMLDSVLKNIMISVPLSYFIWIRLKEKIFIALEKADANQRIATLTICSTIVASLSGSMFLTIMTNGLADQSPPLVVSTPVIHKSSYVHKGTRHYQVVLAAPETSGCCVVPSKTLTLSVSYGEYNSVQAGASKASLAIKEGFFGMPYIKHWSLVPSSLNSAEAQKPQPRGKSRRKKWSEAALAAKKWRPETPTERATEYRLKHWPNGALQSKEPLYEGRVHGVAEFRFANGRLYGMIPFENGEKHGRFILYKENGLPEQELSYKNGQPHGLCRWFNEDGSLKQEAIYVDGNHIVPE